MSQLLLPITGQVAWVGPDLPDPCMLVELTKEQIEALSLAARLLDQRGLTWHTTTAEDYCLSALKPVIRDLLEALEGSPGFSLLRNLPVQLPLAQIKLVLWGLGQHLGFPEPQDAAGHLLHDVRDIGQDLENSDNLRAYQTDREIYFHNDGSDAFMLLCIRPAASGGRSRLVSAVSVFNAIVDQRPDLAEILQLPFPFDARGQQIKGYPRVQTVPIFSAHAGHLNVLYKREYIELAQRFPEVDPLNALQLEALNLMDQLCDQLAIEFTMRSGDLLIANNYDLLHARTPYTDEPGSSDKRRHMLRLWLSLPNGRPLPPHFQHTREFCHSFNRRQGLGLEAP